ncbi:N-acetyltransferase 10 [Exaiptasia diaphana]|nr:N-acetyltransferase 10 [Exaiptasia diaphana]
MKTLPEVYCVLQVALEGEISKATIMNSLSSGKRAAGDLIPWTVSQQFNDHEFGSLSGGRVVRIATHPDYQRMGYGRRAMQQLIQYYEGKIPSLFENGREKNDEISALNDDEDVGLLEEAISPRANLPPLLLKLSERQAERLDYIGVSYGLTTNLLKFWKKSGFAPVYLRQTPNELTGEHSCIMLRMLNEAEVSTNEDWLQAYWQDFRRRFLYLLSYQFSSFHPTLSLSILQQKSMKLKKEAITKSELEYSVTKYDIKRLDLYSRNMVDHHLITDLLPEVARLFFMDKLDFSLSAIQSAILLGVGLQHKTFDDLGKDLELPVSQLLGLFNRIIRKVVQCFNTVLEAAIEDEIVKHKKVTMEPLAKTLTQDLDEAADEMEAKQKKELEQLKALDLGKYAISGKEDEWSQALGGKGKHQSIVSIASSKRKSQATEEGTKSSKKSKKSKKHKK